MFSYDKFSQDIIPSLRSQPSFQPLSRMKKVDSGKSWKTKWLESFRLKVENSNRRWKSKSKVAGYTEFWRLSAFCPQTRVSTFSWNKSVKVEWCYSCPNQLPMGDCGFPPPPKAISRRRLIFSLPQSLELLCPRSLWVSGVLPSQKIFAGNMSIKPVTGASHIWGKPYTNISYKLRTWS